MNDLHLEWCSKQIGLPRNLAKPHVSMGVYDDDRLIAVIVYNNWNPEAGVLELHGAAIESRWLTKPVLHAMFAYPFADAGAQMVVMRVSPNNVSPNGRGIRRILKAYGFSEHRIPRLRGRDEDEMIYTLTDDDWRANGFQRNS